MCAGPEDLFPISQIAHKLNHHHHYEWFSVYCGLWFYVALNSMLWLKWSLVLLCVLIKLVTIA